MSYRLSLAEQETLILWDNELDTCIMETHDLRMKNRLAELAAQYPEVFILKKKDNEGTGRSCSVTYSFPKRLVSIRAPYSEERRQKDRELALAQNRRPPRPSGKE